MRRSRNWIFGLIVLSIVACNSDEAWDCFKTTGEEITDVRILDFFDQIEIRDEITLELVQDTAQYVEVIGGKNILPKISTLVEDRVLKISNDNTCDPVRSFKRDLIVRVHSNNLKRIYTESVKNITSKDTLNFPSFTLEVFNAVGVFEILLNGNFSCYVHSGSIDINVSGKSDSVYVYNAGLGFVNCKDLETPYFHLNHNSTGDAHVFSSNQLFVENEGVGTVYYSGNPNTVHISFPSKKNVSQDEN